jgi:hypothetical protein
MHKRRKMDGVPALETDDDEEVEEIVSTEEEEVPFHKGLGISAQVLVPYSGSIAGTEFIKTLTNTEFGDHIEACDAKVKEWIPVITIAGLIDIIMAYAKEPPGINLRVVLNGSNLGIGGECSPWMKRTSWNGYWLSPLRIPFAMYYLGNPNYNFGIVRQFTYQNQMTGFYYAVGPPPPALQHLDLPAEYKAIAATSCHNEEDVPTCDYIILKQQSASNPYPMVIGVLLVHHPHFRENTSMQVAQVNGLWDRLVTHLCPPEVKIPLTREMLTIFYDAVLPGTGVLPCLDGCVLQASINKHYQELYKEPVPEISLDTISAMLHDVFTSDKQTEEQKQTYKRQSPVKNLQEFIVKWINVPVNECINRMIIIFEHAEHPDWYSTEMWKIKDYNECTTKDTQVNLGNVIGDYDYDHVNVPFNVMVSDTIVDPLDVTRYYIDHELWSDVYMAIYT